MDILHRKLPPDTGVTLYSKMFVVFLYKQDTDAERVILYACTLHKESKKSVWYIPSAQSFIVDPEAEDLLLALLPVYSYSAWAQSKVDKTQKYKTCNGEMRFADVVPKHLWP